MEAGTSERADAAGAPSASRGHRRISVVGILGELLITAGVITLLYVGWQMWVGDLIYSAQRNAAGQELVEEWEQEYSAPVPSGPPTGSPGEQPEDPVAPIIPLTSSTPMQRPSELPSTATAGVDPADVEAADDPVRLREVWAAARARRKALRA